MRAEGTHGRRILTSMILLGCAGIASVLYFDLVYSQYGLLGEKLPNFSPGRLLRSAVILLSVVLTAFGLTGGWPRVQQPVLDPVSRLERPGIVVALCLSCFFVLLFLAFPAVFNNWSQEDGPIEWGSFLLLLGASAILLLSSVKGRREAQWSVPTAGLAALLAFVFLVIAMEEVSWFQRVFDLKTTELFGHNEQNELNFHNFATNRIENLYYFGAFVFLVVLPLLGILFPAVFDGTQIAPLVPVPFVAIIGAMGCAYNFDMWNIAFTQIAFFGSIVALGLLAFLSAKSGERIFIASTALLLVITQIVFLANGENFERLWELTEYKEFFIPLGFLAYSVSVHRNLGDSAATS